MSEESQEVFTKKYMRKLYVVTFLYQCANALLLPIMPYFTNSLNANVTEYGLVFTVYYVAQLISSLSFGWIGDRYGRRLAVSASLIGLTIFTCFEVYCTNVRVLILLRVLTGLFDSFTAVSQACVGDVTNFHQRAGYLAELEAVNNVAQAVGPFIGAVLSDYSLRYAVGAAAIFYILSSIFSVILLPESVPAILERNRMLETLKAQHLPREDYENRKKQLLSQLSLQREGLSQSSAGQSKRLHFNYVMVIALIGEFASRWIVNIFDVTFSVFGEEHFSISSSTYSYASALGSVVNIFQTGWLFNRLLRWDVSIPIITSMTGVCGAIGIFLCLFGTNMPTVFIGSLFFLIAYGCAAPTAPTVMSTESPAHLQGIGTASVLIGGQSAYILAPNVLSGLYSVDWRLPFYVSLVPCAAVFISMIILHFIPGGRTAGQVPLAYALESMVKDQKMAGVDNERENEVIARGGVDRSDARDQKGDQNDLVIEMVVMESKEKDTENGDEHWAMDEEEGVDMDAFVVPPRFDTATAAEEQHTEATVNDGQELNNTPSHQHFSDDESDDNLAI